MNNGDLMDSRGLRAHANRRPPLVCLQLILPIAVSAAAAAAAA